MSRSRFEQLDAPIAILGGGIAGLTAATHLQNHKVPFVLFEGSGAVAGLMQSHRDEDGFTYDCGVHFVTNRLAAAVGMATQCRPMSQYGESVYLKGRWYSYPLGLIRSPRFLASALYGRALSFVSAKPTSARDYYHQCYGKKLADEIALPLTEAWSGHPAGEIAASVGQKFATSLPRMLMLKGCAWMTNRVIGIGYAATITESSNSWHVYPNSGIAAICQTQADEVEANVKLNSKVEQINVADNRVRSVVVNGSEIPVSGVIATAPVHVLARITKGTNRLDGLSAFRYRAMVFVNLKLQGQSGLQDVVTWVPEAEFPFFRVSDVGMGLPFLVPDGKAHVTCDIGCQVGDSVWNASDEDLASQCAECLDRIIPGLKGRVMGSRVVRVPLAYPIFHLDYERDRQAFIQGTGIDGLVSVGRNGEFAHILMEDVFWRTRWKVSSFLEQLLPQPAQ